MKFTISPGFTDTERPQVAALYWEAFSAKLRHVMGPPHKALAFIAAQANPEYAIVARGTDGALLGLAGYKTAQGALIGGGMRDLAAVYGWLSTLWRSPLLAVVDRDLAADTLLMDGICVASAARGAGLGTALLHAIRQEAKKRGLRTVRLDVIDSNPRARALYERQGFRATRTEHIGPLRLVFGFRSSTRMLCAVE